MADTSQESVLATGSRQGSRSIYSQSRRPSWTEGYGAFMDHANEELAKMFEGFEQQSHDIADQVQALRMANAASGMIEEELAAVERRARELAGEFNTIAMQVGDSTD